VILNKFKKNTKKSHTQTSPMLAKLNNFVGWQLANSKFQVKWEGFILWYRFNGAYVAKLFKILNNMASCLNDITLYTQLNVIKQKFWL